MNSLKTLLDDLESIWVDHLEVEDTDVREQMYHAVYCGFIAQAADYGLPATFGMFENAGDARVRDALSRFLVTAPSEARALGLVTPEQRFRAFQNGDIVSEGGKSYDDFFGSSDSYENLKSFLDP